MLTRPAIFAVLILQFATLGNFCQEDTEVEFPLDAVGTLYYAPPETVQFGAQAHVARHVTDWEFFASAAGKVQLPKGMLIRLDLQATPAASKGSASSKDTSWVKQIPSDAIHSLYIVNTPLSDKEFSEFASWPDCKNLN